MKNNTLVVFERTVNFQKIFDDKKRRDEFFIVEGPGLIIFELNHHNTKKIEAVKNLKLIGILTFVLALLATLGYLAEEFKFNL